MSEDKPNYLIFDDGMSPLFEKINNKFDHEMNYVNKTRLFFNS